jgi:hypothetical protein
MDDAEGSSSWRTVAAKVCLLRHHSECTERVRGQLNDRAHGQAHNQGGNATQVLRLRALCYVVWNSLQHTRTTQTKNPGQGHRHGGNSNTT